MNRFAPPEITDPEFSSAWLYNDADEQWAQWLPTEVSSTIRHGGYYTTLARPGLRIVSMNMNYCYIYNWWMLYKSQDPASGLLWLREILEKAEAAGEKVFILYNDIIHVLPHLLGLYLYRYIFSLISQLEMTIVYPFSVENSPRLSTGSSQLSWRNSTVTLTTRSTRYFTTKRRAIDQLT